MNVAAPVGPIMIEAVEHGQRIDRVLTQRLTGLSRARVQVLIRAGHVSRAGRTISDPGERVKQGEEIVVSVPEPEAPALSGEALPLAIVFEDRHVVVLDKPAGLVVHPAPGHGSGTLVNALIAHCGDSLSGIGGVRRPGIVHRLDKDTSGLLVVAKDDASHRGLSEQFAAHGRDGRLHRAYLALVWGVLDRPQGAIDAPLGRSTMNRLKMAVSRAGSSREAVTHYRVLETFKGTSGEPAVSLIRLELETGRTHQIRVHLAHIGHPLLGDAVYGAGFKASANKLAPQARAALVALGRQALHAAVLGFEHPVTGKPLQFESTLPADLALLVDALRGKPATAPVEAARRRR